METPLIRNVSDTAFMVAAYRARETARPDALFHDPFAARLAGEQGPKILAAMPKHAFMGGWNVTIRTVIIDRYLTNAIAAGADTVLNLGAGLDARPFRMALPPALRWIEVDYPHMLDYKAAQLAGEKPQCRLEHVKLDLADRDARRALFDQVARTSQRVLVLTEGVIPYLTPDEVAALADDLRAQPAFRQWIADYFSPETQKYRQRRNIQKHMANAPFRFVPADYFGFFAEHGWKARDITYVGDEAGRLKRFPPLPLHLKLFIRFAMLFTPKARKGEFGRFAGYVLFEPA